MDYRIEQVNVDDVALREILQLMVLAFEGHAEKFSMKYLK